MLYKEQIENLKAQMNEKDQLLQNQKKETEFGPVGSPNSTKEQKSANEMEKLIKRIEELELLE